MNTLIQKMPKLIDIELRLFDGTNRTTDNTTGNDLSPEMKTYYHQRVIDNAEPELIHDQFGSPYPIPKNGGKTIEFRRYSPLPKSLTPLSEGVTPAGKKLNVSTVTATIDQYGDYVELSDLLEFTAIDRNIEEATILLGSQAGRTLDTITREVLNGGTNKIFAPKVIGGVETEVLLRESVTRDCLLTPKVIREAVNQLKRMNTKPIGGTFAAIVHPDVTCDLMGSTEWQEVHKYAKPDNIFAGEIGQLYKCRFAETTEAKIIGPAYLFGSKGNGGVCRMSLKTALDATGSTNIMTNETITTAQEAELTARISGGETVKIYVGGNEATIVSVTAGDPGVAKFVVNAAVKSVPVGGMICGTGAGRDGSAIYSTLLIGLNAYGTTEIQGLGLQHIVKQLGSGGTTDPINQRSTVGWKATKVAERLVEAYMIRIEHSSAYGLKAESN